MYSLNMRTNKTETNVVNTIDGDLTVEFRDNIAFISLVFDGLTKQQFAEKMRGYLLPGETLGFEGDKLVLSRKRAEIPSPKYDTFKANQTRINYGKPTKSYSDEPTSKHIYPRKSVCVPPADPMQIITDAPASRIIPSDSNLKCAMTKRPSLDEKESKLINIKYR